MAEQEQVKEQAVEQNEEQPTQIRIGFEAALDALDPDWKSTWPTEQVHTALHFYSAGVQAHSVYTSNYVENTQKSINDYAEALKQTSLVYVGHLQTGINWIQDNILTTLEIHQNANGVAGTAEVDLSAEESEEELPD